MFIITLLIVYFAVVNSFQTVSFSEEEKTMTYDKDKSVGKIDETGSTPASHLSSGRSHTGNFSQPTMQSNSLKDWQIFIRGTLREFEGNECMLKLYQYGDHHASEKNFDRVGYINEILRFKGDIYDVTSLLCNMYSRRIEISETEFLEEISSFDLSDLHKELFYSAAITSFVIQDADVDKLKLFLEKSSDTILNKYISGSINGR